MREGWDRERWSEGGVEIGRGGVRERWKRGGGEGGVGRCFVKLKCMPKMFTRKKLQLF